MIIRRFITFVIAVSLAFSVSTAMAGKSDKCSYKAQCWPLAERKLLDKWAANTLDCGNVKTEATTKFCDLGHVCTNFTRYFTRKVSEFDVTFSLVGSTYRYLR